MMETELFSVVVVMTNDVYISPYRAAEAQRIYQELSDMTEAMHITDSLFAYLQSGGFLFVITLIVVGRYFMTRKKNEGE